MSTLQSILPEFDVFVAPGISVAPNAITEAAAGTGQSGLGKSRLFALSPVLATMKGLGADEPAVPGMPAPAVGAGDALLGLLILGAIGALGYQAGKAMAPSSSDRTTWGWIGVPVTLFTGGIGLGVMGIVSNRKG